MFVRLAHGLHFPGADSTSGNTSGADDHKICSVLLRAGCNIKQGVTTFCRAALGVHCLAHPVHAAADKASSGCSELRQIDASDNHMVVTTTDGQVFAVSMIDVDMRRGKFDT